jgi:outer membrane protein TolC
MEVFADSIAVLVRNELRPGADESRARAELAQARTDQIRAEQAAQAALATVAEWMGVAGTTLQVQAGPLLADLPVLLDEGGRLDAHPLARAQDAEVAVVEARRQATLKEWRPTFEVQSALYGRGTGASVDGVFDGGAHGLAPSRGNWAVGVSLRFNVMDYKQNRLRRQIEEHREDSERARKERVVQQLTGDVARARIAVDAARRVAANTPIGLEAARTLETQAQARYRASLATVIEVADAQRLLRQAEVDDALARLGIWRAQLVLAAAQGEIEAVLAAASR